MSPVIHSAVLSDVWQWWYRFVFAFVQNSFVYRFIVFINVLRVSQWIFVLLNNGSACWHTGNSCTKLWIIWAWCMRKIQQCSSLAQSNVLNRGQCVMTLTRMLYLHQWIQLCRRSCRDNFLTAVIRRGGLSHIPLSLHEQKNSTASITLDCWQCLCSFLL